MFLTRSQVILLFCDEILSKAASFVADHESDDDQSSDGGINAVGEVLDCVKGFAQVPAGGAGTDHHQVLAR